MDALDVAILRELGVEPFAGFAQRPQGLRASDVARSLGRNVRLVQDRITRMEEVGAIRGYALVPNPRHLGLELSTVHVPTHGAAGPSVLEGLSSLDGFVSVVSYLGSGICLKLSHRSAAELARRLDNARRLAGDAGEPRIMYRQSLPAVERDLTPLDWRIVAAFAPDPKRRLQEAADEVGVTIKTLRGRLKRMRDEGSVDEVAQLDFTRIEGVLPFEIAVWCDGADIVTPRLLERLADNHWLHFRGPSDGYCDLLVRVFTTSPAEANQLVKAAEDVPGVRKAQPLMAAGARHDPRWVDEAIASRVAAATRS